MAITMKKLLKALGWVLAGVPVIIVGAGLILVIPGTPSSAKSLDFKGYVLLPEGKWLTVLDYLSIIDNHLFITDSSSGSVYKVALSSGLPGDSDISTYAGEPAVHGVVLDPDSHLAYVTRSEANTVDVFDPVTMKPVLHIPVADDPDGIFYDPKHKLIYAVSGDANTGTVIDPHRRATVATIPLGGKPEYAVFDAQTGLIYQNLKDANRVIAVDLQAKTQRPGFELPGCEAPSGMAFDERSRRLFVACSGNSRLLVIDLDKKSVVQSFPIGGSPDSVVFDAGLRRIYTTGKSGVMVVLQQETSDAYSIIDSVKLHYGAHTLAVDAATHGVYVGYASLLVRARIAVFMPHL